MRTTSTVATLLLVLGSPLFASAPELMRIEPRGAERGKAVQLSLRGYGLTADARLLTSVPGALTKLTPKRDGDRELRYLLELTQDARVGAYPVRVETGDGISNILLFTVGPFPEATEAESESRRQEYSNDSDEGAEPFESPVTVNGTLRGADRDWYRISGKPGRKVVFEVEARRIGSAVDPVLIIRDFEGNLLGRANDSEGAGVDARTEISFPADGTVYVEVHDARFSAQTEDFYRLKVGPYSYAAGIFPLGWRRGDKLKVEMFGGNLAEPVKVEPDLSAAATASGYSMLHLPGDSASLPLRMVVSDSREVLEPKGKGPHKIKPRVVMNGRIWQPREIDRYRLAVKPGEHWMIETQAAGLGTSALYGLITIYDKDGKKLASAGDQEPEEPLSFISSTGETFGDPHLGFQAPEGVNEILISIEDLLGRGGSGYGYRLVARPQPPDFTLTLSTPLVNIPQEGSALVNVTVDRRGYMGDIKLTVPDLPDDLVLRGGHVPAEVGGMTPSRTSRRGLLTLEPKPGAKPRELDLVVWGEGKAEDGRTIRVRAQAPGMMAVVKGSKQTPVTAPWLAATLPARIAEPDAGALEVLTPLHVRLIQGMEHDVEFAFESREDGARLTDRVDVINIPNVGNVRVIGQAKNKKGGKKGRLKVITTMGTLPMTFDLVLTAPAMIGGRERTLASPAITFEVVQGYRVQPPTKPVVISRGDTAEITGAFHREPGFLSPVTVKANNLPLGVECEPVEIQASPNRYRLPCRADSTAQPGEYEVELAPASTLAGAFSNPRMILKWGGLGKGTALGVDLLSEVFEGGGGLRGRGKLRKLLPGSQNCVELPSPPPSNAETRAVRPGLKTLGFTSGSGTGPAVSS